MDEFEMDVEEVNGKLAGVGARLVDTERALAVRRLRCQELDEEIKCVRQIITENAHEALETTSSLNRAKFKLSAVDRAVLALVSEVTMYRALTAALANAKSRNIAEVDSLRLALETTDDCAQTVTHDTNDASLEVLTM